MQVVHNLLGDDSQEETNDLFIEEDLLVAA